MVHNWFFNLVTYGSRLEKSTFCTNPEKSFYALQKEKTSQDQAKKKSDKDIKKQLISNRLTAWSVALLLYGTGIKRSCNSPPITLDGKQQQNINTNDTHDFHLFIFKGFYFYEKIYFPNYSSKSEVTIFNLFKATIQ